MVIHMKRFVCQQIFKIAKSLKNLNSKLFIEQKQKNLPVQSFELFAIRIVRA